MSEIDDLLKAADRALAVNNLDAAESIVDGLLMKVKQAADDSDDSDYDDASNPSMDAADDDNGSDDEADDEDEEEDVSKAYHERSTSGAPTRMRGQHVAVNRPDTYRISATPPPEGPGKRHKFEARVDYIKDRDNISRTQAMSRARAEFPQTYTSYQRHLASRTTRQQHMVRGWDRVGKSAPTSYEELVSEQIAKGCSYELPSSASPRPMASGPSTPVS
jgi:hypothetical protein